MADIVHAGVLDDSPQLLIGGTRQSGYQRLDDIEPSSGRLLARIPIATAVHVDAAVDAAQRAQAAWIMLSARERGAQIAAFAAAVRLRADELGYLDAVDAGNPITGMRADVEKGAAALEFFAGLSTELQGRTIPATADHLHFTVHDPIGIVAVITAYNHPALFALARIAAPLVAGNAVLLKPPEQAPLSSLRIGEIASEFLPAGLLTVLPGGAATGDALVTRPSVGRVAFTGSVTTALTIQRRAAESGAIKRLSFELGGKNALIILPDVSSGAAAQAAVDGMNLQRVLGQSCGSTSRAFVHESIYDEFSERVAAIFSSLRPGKPELPETELGPLVSEDQLLSVSAYVEEARTSGVEISIGGHRACPPGQEGGYYYAPTLMRTRDSGSRAAREEIFGPVLTAIPWTDEQEMLTAVNGTRYGLTAAIYTNDLSAALRLVEQVQAGYLWVNDVEKRWLGVPFGGRRDSGTATEYSIDELYENTYIKSVSIRR